MASDLIGMLFEGGHLSTSTRGMVSDFVAKWDCGHFDALVDCNIFSESELADRISEILGLDRIYSLGLDGVSQEALALVDFRDSYECGILPMQMEESGVVSIAIYDPFSSAAQSLQKSWSYATELYVVEKSMIRRRIIEAYPVGQQVKSLKRE